MANINGSINKDTLSGGYEADFISGFDEADTLLGRFGNDFLFGGEGTDLLYGHENDDNLLGEAGADTLFGGSGRDTLSGGAGADRIYGDAGDDFISIGSLEDGAGDLIVGGEGIDTLQMFLFFPTATPVIFAAANPLNSTIINGNIRVTGVEQWQVFGSDGADRMTGYVLNDILSGNAGADTLRGMGGVDIIDGGEGADSVYGGADGDVVSGGGGADRVFGEAGNDVLQGDGFGDGVTVGADTLYGGEGGDIMSGQGGADSLFGENGDDIIYSDGSDIVSSDLSDLGAEIDLVTAGGGDDVVTIGKGDSANGGANVDTLVLTLQSSTVAENFALVNAATTLASGGTVTAFEQLRFTGGNRADSVTGGALGDTLDGGLGNDTMRGGIGADVLQDSAGVDRLYGDGDGDIFNLDANSLSLQADTFDGGAGTDAIFFDADGEAQISALLDLGNQALSNGLIRFDTFIDIELFHATELDDTMRGSAGADSFFGEGSDDILDGRAGDDVLVGGEGSDQFTGGTGLDIFDITPTSFSMLWEGDHITDFTRGQDKLRIDLSEFDVVDTADFRLAVGANPVAPTAEATFLFNTTTKQLWFDLDGNGANSDAVLIVTLTGVPTLAVSDFDLIV